MTSMQRIKIISSQLLLTVAASLVCFSAIAQKYPAKPITIVVGASAGGTTDIVARVIANELGKRLKQTVIVQNRAGAGGNIALGAVARAAPDGYTLGMAYSGLAINPTVMSNMPFDTLKDLAPVSLVATVDMVLLTNPALGIRSVQDLIDAAKRQPERFALAANALGSVSHLSAASFKLRTGVEIPIVVYKGSAPALVDMIGGSVSAMFDTIPGALSYIQQGQLNAIAVGATHRLPTMPNVPTLEEAGLKDFKIGSWYGVVAPAMTPAPVLDTLSRTIAEILSDPEIKNRLSSQMLNLKGTSPAEFKSFLISEMKRWEEIAKSAKITIG